MKPDLESAIRAVEALAGRGAPLTRHDARPILLRIGWSLLAGRPEGLEDARDRLRRLPERPRTSWIAAVQDELSMASAEYVRSVDPRYLDHPQYDLDYTLEARRLLEARWRACAYLGQPPDAAAVASVRRADTLLESRTSARIAECLSNPGAHEPN